MIKPELLTQRKNSFGSLLAPSLFNDPIKLADGRSKNCSRRKVDTKCIRHARFQFRLGISKRSILEDVLESFQRGLIVRLSVKIRVPV